ncbi:MAG: right-handed parallel beta-helix repeat-containing protein [Phycisphaerae bacterium]
MPPRSSASRSPAPTRRANIVGEPGKTAIEIAASDVTLDLRGFELRGVAGSLSGVRVAGGQRGVRVHGGAARDWPGVGVDVSDALAVALDDLSALGCGTGILAANQARLTRCLAGECVGSGIAVGQGCLIADCLSRFNGGSGFYVLEGSRLERCTAELNGSDGFYLDGDAARVVESSAIGNGRHGVAAIYGATLERVTADLNLARGIWSLGAMDARACRAAANAEAGLYLGAGSRAVDCLVHANGQDGIRIEGDGELRNNLARGQAAGAGLRVVGANHRVCDNHLVGNAVGLAVEGTGNLVIRNSAAGNRSAYAIAPGNAVGPILNAATIGAATNPFANFE